MTERIRQQPVLEFSYFDAGNLVTGCIVPQGYTKDNRPYFSEKYVDGVTDRLGAPDGASLVFSLGIAALETPNETGSTEREPVEHRDHPRILRLCGGFVDYHIEEGSLRLDGRSVSLTLRERELLKALVSSPGRLLTRKYLTHNVWGYKGEGPVSRTVDVHVGRIRRKLGPYAGWVRTVEGGWVSGGYIYTSPEDTHHEGSQGS